MPRDLEGAFFGRLEGPPELHRPDLGELDQVVEFHDGITRPPARREFELDRESAQGKTEGGGRGERESNWSPQKRSAFSLCRPWSSKTFEMLTLCETERRVLSNVVGGPRPGPQIGLGTPLGGLLGWGFRVQMLSITLLCPFCDLRRPRGRFGRALAAAHRASRGRCVTSDNSGPAPDQTKKSTPAVG